MNAEAYLEFGLNELLSDLEVAYQEMRAGALDEARGIEIEAKVIIAQQLQAYLYGDTLREIRRSANERLLGSIYGCRPEMVPSVLHERMRRLKNG